MSIMGTAVSVPSPRADEEEGHPCPGLALTLPPPSPHRVHKAPWDLQDLLEPGESR